MQTIKYPSKKALAAFAEQCRVAVRTHAKTKDLESLGDEYIKEAEHQEGTDYWLNFMRIDNNEMALEDLQGDFDLYVEGKAELDAYLLERTHGALPLM